MEEEPAQIIDEQIVETNATKKKNIVVIGVVLIIISLIAGFTIYSIRTDKSTLEKVTNAIPLVSTKTPSATPTPYPFQEMTIPALRNREYKSSLGEQTVYAQVSNYTSYLTNYDSDGLQINGLLLEPTGEMPKGGFPAIVFIHGYIPPSIYQTTSQYADYVDYLARNGFVVFKIDLRGHGTSEGEPGGAYFSSDYVIDALNAIAALQSTDFVNPDKVGLWGHSMAGNVSLRTFAAKPDIPAVVIWAGAVYSYSDFEKYRIQDSSYRPPQDITQSQQRRQRLRDTYGEYDPNQKFWQEFPATNYLSELQGAIQINHAVDDDVVNIGYSRDLMQLLDKTDVPHELNEYPSGGHNISGSSFVSAMENTVAVYKKYLGE